MNLPTLSQLVPILQLAVGPVILISGVGLLQLSLTNRLGRLIDRARLLSRERTAAAPGDVVLFCCALLTLIGSNVFFIREMNLSLEAVHLKLRRE